MSLSATQIHFEVRSGEKSKQTLVLRNDGALSCSFQVLEEMTGEDSAIKDATGNGELESSDEWVNVKKTLVQASCKAEDELHFPMNGEVSKREYLLVGSHTPLFKHTISLLLCIRSKDTARSIWTSNLLLRQAMHPKLAYLSSDLE